MLPCRQQKKRHDQVLRAFDTLECPVDFRQHNFVAAEDPDAQGKNRRVIRMTKDGFMLLAMGFTGVKAVLIKIAFINAFNSMAEQLQRLGDSLWAQRLDLEKREATSFMWASFGAKRMQERRWEKPLLQNERSILDSEMQPELFRPLTPKESRLQ